MSENNDILLDIIMALHKRLIAPSVGFAAMNSITRVEEKATKSWTSSQIWFILFFPLFAKQSTI